MRLSPGSAGWQPREMSAFPKLWWRWARFRPWLARLASKLPTEFYLVIVPFTHLAREGRMTVTIGRRELLAALGGAPSLFFCVNAAAQEGYYGAGHDTWHQGFYSQLRRNDGGSCCNLMDCRPTQSRIVGDHYEVKVDGVWTPVPYNKINNVVAPDGGAHVCAPRQVGPNKGVPARCRGKKRN